MSRKHTPTPDQQHTVLMGAGIGLTEEQIALLVGCSDRSLRKVYKAELRDGHVEAN